MVQRIIPTVDLRQTPRHPPDEDDPWNGPRMAMWAAVTVGCGIASILTHNAVPILATGAAAGCWPAVVRAMRR